MTVMVFIAAKLTNLHDPPDLTGERDRVDFIEMDEKKRHSNQSTAEFEKLNDKKIHPLTSSSEIDTSYTIKVMGANNSIDKLKVKNPFEGSQEKEVGFVCQLVDRMNQKVITDWNLRIGSPIDLENKSQVSGLTWTQPNFLGEAKISFKPSKKGLVIEDRIFLNVQLKLKDVEGKAIYMIKEEDWKNGEWKMPACIEEYASNKEDNSLDFNRTIGDSKTYLILKKVKL